MTVRDGVVAEGFDEGWIYRRPARRLSPCELSFRYAA